MSFLDNLKNKKNERHLTTGDLSVLSTIPVGTLNKILSGATEEPKLSVAVSLASALGVSLDELCGLSAFSEEEKTLIDIYRTCDGYSKKIIMELAKSESERGISASTDTESTKILPFEKSKKPKKDASKCVLPLYLLPVSAGRGTFLEGYDTETVTVRRTPISEKADFALRISGNSMEPRFHDGDMLLVVKQNRVEEEELGIFIGDGEGYFKCFRGDVLHSFNADYADIPIAGFADFRCVGKVIGRFTRS